MPPVTLDNLKNVVGLSEMPDEHLQWILDRSKYEEHSSGGLISKFGDTAESMWIALAGKVDYYMNFNGRQVYYFTFDNDNITGGIGGLMPYSRMVTYPGYSYASGEVKLIRLHKKYFHDLEQLNPDFIQKLIGYMTERARVFATTQLHHEKVNALGNLAAGIAHELNNPAAAINRIAHELKKRLIHNYDLTKSLLRGNMTPEHLESLHGLVLQKKDAINNVVKLSALQRINNEDDMAEWLENNGVTARETAETLSEFGFTINEMQHVKNDLGDTAFTGALPWLENLLSSQKILKDLDDASTRISHLVGSIKSHVHMDRTNELQPTNIHQDIENTLTLLGFKIREKNISIIRKFYADLPDIPAYVGELNQVWTNLIDNAIYALENGGNITIETSIDDHNLHVMITDNGVGIPQTIQSQIFDPFFTTKKVGVGTGIGLDLVNRIIKKHNGNIKLASVPGKTEFAISIPLVQHEPIK